MNVMRRLHTFVAAWVLALVPGLVAQAHDPCQNVIPPDAQALIASKFPGWRVKLLSDLGADDHQLWTKAKPRECPGIATGHFEDADSLAYAVVLVDKSDANAGYKIVVLSKSAKTEAFAVRILDHAEGARNGASSLVISKLGPGTYPNFDQTKSLRLKLDSINVEWLEAAAVVYYWSNGRYRTLQTED
jgi:hypothetical protein